MTGRGECFVDGNLDRGEFGVGHAYEVEQVQSGVYEGNVEVCFALECMRDGVGC